MYLSEQDKQQLAEWKKRWKENGPEMQELHRLMRETRKIEVDCKCGNTYVKTMRDGSEKEYSYGAQEVSLDAMEDENGLEIASPDCVYDGIEKKIRNAALYRAMSRLSDDDRKIIVLIVLHDMSEREVSEKLGMSRMFIHRRKHHALDMMRDYLEQFKDEVDRA